MKILADATLPHVHEWFGDAFQLTLFDSPDEIPKLLAAQDILLCRSTLNVTEKLLAKSAIQCVATASSGSEHLDSSLPKKGITVFDAKGCNARAVADYVVATLAYLSQHHDIGSLAGIIGCGHVGSDVKSRIQAMGLETLCYDPLKASMDNSFRSCSPDELTACSLLCIHANWHETPPYPSVNLGSKSFLQRLKPKTIIINAARGGIVNEEDVINTGSELIYCTDVYHFEPHINPNIIDVATICTPHIAGHSIEAKLAAVEIISQKIHHHYGLPLPIVTQSSPNVELMVSKDFGNSSWQDIALQLYNPYQETLILKKSSDKCHAFLTQRKAHTHRHDFNQYIFTTDEKIQKILGK
ncbi:MAG: 4-phosphoerythronate dehydrogenase [Legionellales bacterium]|nr:4-phosphoerythronate dehydrogenase [Legionellales bacterium]